MDPTQQNLTPAQIQMLMNMLNNPQTSQMSVPDQQGSLGQQNAMNQMAGLGNQAMGLGTSPAMTGMPAPSASGPGAQPQTFSGITPAAYSAMFGVPATTNPSYGASPY